MRKFTLILTVLCLTLAISALAKENTGKRFDFASSVLLKKEWMTKGKQFGVPMSSFVIVPSAGAGDKRALSVKTDSSSGILVTRIPEELWSQYPVLRWRWRILKKAVFSGKEPDDQAAVLYFGDGTMLKQNISALEIFICASLDQCGKSISILLIDTGAWILTKSTNK